MSTNRDLLKEAIADAKAVKETAIANAKAALEEAFTPYLKEKLTSKINEMDQEDEEMTNEAEKMEDMTDEEISLDELLKELDEESTDEIQEADEKEEKEEEISIEDMSEDDLKSFIEDVIKDMVEAGELEAGEEEAEEAGEEMDIDLETDDLETDDLETDDLETDDLETDEEEINIDELLAELETETELEEVSDLTFGLSDAAMAFLTTGFGAALAAKIAQVAKNDKEAASEIEKKAKEKSKTDEELNEQIKKLHNTLNESNILNSKLLYSNKIFRDKTLTSTQKVKIVAAFDKATSKKEAQLVYETLLESLKTTNKTPIKESLSSASKVLGNTIAKPIIEDDAFSRMRELAFGRNKQTN